MKLKNTIEQQRLINSLSAAREYKWRGGKDACYEIYDIDGNILFGKIWSEDQAIAIMTLAEMIQGKTNLETFTSR